MIGQERNKYFHGEKNLDSRLLGDEYFVLDILDILDGLEKEPPTKPLPIRPDLADKMEQLRSALTHHPVSAARPKRVEV